MSRVLAGAAKTALLVLAVAGLWFAYRRKSDTLLRMAEPGALSRVHASLVGDCRNCHTSTTGISRNNCIECHATANALLSLPQTKFHAEISSCSECHVEHLGNDRVPVQMDHTALVSIGRAMSSPPGSVPPKLVSWLRVTQTKILTGVNPLANEAEHVLNCVACHSMKDRHLGTFGGDCAACHTTTAWQIAGFRHPLEGRDCVQCHQAPPSHYMEHFEMVSMTVARVKRANVRDCYLCHQITHWNDIKGVGYYKHH